MLIAAWISVFILLPFFEVGVCKPVSSGELSVTHFSVSICVLIIFVFASVIGTIICCEKKRKRKDRSSGREVSVEESTSRKTKKTAANKEASRSKTTKSKSIATKTSKATRKSKTVTRSRSKTGKNESQNSEPKSKTQVTKNTKGTERKKNVAKQQSSRSERQPKGHSALYIKETKKTTNEHQRRGKNAKEYVTMNVDSTVLVKKPKTGPTKKANALDRQTKVPAVQPPSSSPGPSSVPLLSLPEEESNQETVVIVKQKKAIGSPHQLKEAKYKPIVQPPNEPNDKGQDQKQNKPRVYGKENMEEKKTKTKASSANRIDRTGTS